MSRLGAFIYALSADENRAVLAASRHAIIALFSCRENAVALPGGNAVRVYNTLHFASKIVFPKGHCPL